MLLNANFSLSYSGVLFAVKAADLLSRGFGASSGALGDLKRQGHGACPVGGLVEVCKTVICNIF